MADISVPERFVYVWGQLQAMPGFSAENPAGVTMRVMKETAEQIINDALRQALLISGEMHALKRRVDEYMAEQEVPGHGC